MDVFSTARMSLLSVNKQLSQDIGIDRPHIRHSIIDHERESSDDVVITFVNLNTDAETPDWVRRLVLVLEDLKTLSPEIYARIIDSRKDGEFYVIDGVE